MKRNTDRTSKSCAIPIDPGKQSSRYKMADFLKKLKLVMFVMTS